MLIVVFWCFLFNLTFCFDIWFIFDIRCYSGHFEAILRDRKQLCKFYAISYHDSVPWFKFVSSGASNLIELGVRKVKFGSTVKEVEKLSKIEHLKIVYEVPAMFDCDNWWRCLLIVYEREMSLYWAVFIYWDGLL